MILVVVLTLLLIAIVIWYFDRKMKNIEGEYKEITILKL